MPPLFLLGFAAGLQLAFHWLRSPCRVLNRRLLAGRERPLAAVGPAAFEHRGLAHSG